MLIIIIIKFQSSSKTAREKESWNAEQLEC